MDEGRWMRDDDLEIKILANYLECSRFLHIFAVYNKKGMRHRIKAGKVGSFTPENQKIEVEQLEDREVAEDVEEIFEEDSNFSNDDEALAAMEFYDSPDAME